MTEITIRAFAKFRELFGAETKISVPSGASVYDGLLAFAEVKNAEAELFAETELKPHIVLMYNRERIDAEDAKSISLKDGDEIVLYPPVSGG
ncbi:MAG: MoaD/ThiS family protein [Methanocorpusculum sp.]|nr:MoaD/ThiS family protein [Methanocorpusculum sp.]